MSKYDIITMPDAVLKTRANEVGGVNADIQKQMDNMLETMYDAPGIGLAANQVNMLNRVLVMDVDFREDEGKKNPICMVNPEVIWTSGEKSVMEEGCLSIPNQYGKVERPAIVRVKYWDYEGKDADLEAEGLLSHCVQHEIDHLDGVLFIDYLSKLKRDMIVRKVGKMKKTGGIL